MCHSVKCRFSGYNEDSSSKEFLIQFSNLLVPFVPQRARTTKFPLLFRYEYNFCVLKAMLNSRGHSSALTLLFISSANIRRDLLLFGCPNQNQPPTTAKSTLVARVGKHRGFGRSHPRPFSRVDLSRAVAFCRNNCGYRLQLYVSTSLSRLWRKVKLAEGFAGRFCPSLGVDAVLIYGSSSLRITNLFTERASRVSAPPLSPLSPLLLSVSLFL